MERDYTAILFRGWQVILSFALAGLVLALLTSFAQPLKYSSTVRLLVLNISDSSADSYSVSRSEERIADGLATIIHTTSFYDQVISSGFSIDNNYFSKEEIKRRRLWKKTLHPVVSRGSGLLTITAYHPDVRQAEQIVRAASFVLTENISDYRPGGNVLIKLVDEPLNSRWIVQPNLIANALSGFVIGVLIGGVYVVLKTEKIRRKHQIIHEY